MTSVLHNAMLRIASMEKQALADMTPSVAADAVAFFPWEQESFPYFLNWLSGYRERLSIDDLDDDSAEDIPVEWWTVTIRLVVGHLTQGYKGETALNLYDYMPAITQYFRTHPYLTSDDYTTPLDMIGPLSLTIPDGTGLRVFTNAGISSQQVGTEFTLQIPILINAY